MKKSKSSSGSKRKGRSSDVKSKKKRLESLPKASEKQKKKESEDKHPRKTRWETSKSNPPDETSNQTSASKDEDAPHPEPPRRIKDLLEDKEKIVEYLFLTVTGTALQELIPDYLKKRSAEELKTLCISEIKDMSEDHIMKIVKGKDPSSFQESRTTESREDVKPVEETGIQTEEEKSQDSDMFPDSSSSPHVPVSESFSSDILELCASSNEMESITENENQVPISIENVTKDLRLPESDADLLELEMRARAIRSLLKAKSQDVSDSEARD